MYAAVDGTSMWSCLYFISVVIFGHYLLLNLFLAGIVRNVVDQFGKEKALRRLAETRKNASTSGESEAGPVEVNRRRQSITHFLLGGRRLTGGAKTAGESR